LAYEEVGQLIPVAKGGPLRITIVCPGNPITPGKFWVKWVERIEIEEVAPEKFSLTPIVLVDVREKIEISIDDVAKYYGTYACMAE
jgi:DMSO/TMAO reductase YedYZ molybdopterin-dependent catalytic subunit